MDTKKCTYKTIECDEIEFVGVLGSGGNGMLHSARWNDKLVAVKELLVGENGSIADLCKEAEVQAQVGHSGEITRVHGVCILNDQTIWIVMELSKEGDLYHYLCSLEHPLPHAVQISLCTSAFSAVSVLHDSNPPIIHRDLKSHNFLKNHFGYSLKLTDFGMATPVTNAGKTLGTLAWTPPEVLRGDSDWTTHSDIFSLGMVFYEIVSRKMPFCDIADNATITQLILSGVRPVIPAECDPELRAIIESCWVENPLLRPSTTTLGLQLYRLQAGTDRIRYDPASLFRCSLGIIAEQQRVLCRGVTQPIDPSAIDYEDGRVTPLMTAIASGNLETVQKLIQMGANVNGICHPGYSPVHVAAMLDFPEVIPYLVAAGADLEQQVGGQTALNYACVYRHERVVKALLEHGANVNAGERHRTIMSAICSGSINNIYLLMRYGASLPEGALHVAAQYGQAGVVVELVTKMGMDVNYIYNNRPVLLSALTGGYKTMETVLNFGADVKFKTSTGCTVLKLAVQDGHEDLLELLVRHGVDIEAKDEDEFTALLSAAILGNLRITQMLINLGASVKTRLSEEKCILRAVIEVDGSYGVVELLIQNGADLDHVDNRRCTPLMLAASMGGMEYVNILLRYWHPYYIGSLPAAMAIARRRGFMNVHKAIEVHYQRICTEVAALMKIPMVASSAVESEDEELERAMAMSLEEKGTSPNSHLQEEASEEEELERAIAMSFGVNTNDEAEGLERAFAMSLERSNCNSNDISEECSHTVQDNEQEEMSRALAMSLERNVSSNVAESNCKH